jgi:hypothetical protein
LTLSNLYAGNVFTNFISVSNILIPGSSPVPGYVLSTTGTSISWVAQSGGGSSQWTSLVSGNTIYYSNNVGIGSTAVPTANLTVTGNIYASNALSTTNVFATTANIVTLNVQTLNGYGGMPVWTAAPGPPPTRTLTSFQDESGQTSLVVNSVFTTSSGKTNLVLTLASFTPTFTTTSFISVNWDQPVSSSSGEIFRVVVGNPTTYTTAYISGVYSISGTSGTVPLITNWTGGTALPAYAAATTTTQSYSLSPGYYIYTNAAAGSITGGTAQATLAFSAQGYTSPYSPSSSQTFTVTWNNIGQTITLTSLETITFLQSFTSTTWSTSITNVSLGAVTSQSTTQTNGSGTITPSGLSSSGIMTFGTPLFKDNIGLTTSISFTVYYLRPANITDSSSHSAGPITVSSVNINTTGSFSYPSFWLFKLSGSPVVGDIVSGTSIISSTYQNNPALGDRVKSLAQYVTNPQSYTQTFWFGILASASQPASFNSGSSPSLISSRTPTTATVDLYPTPTPGGWTTTTYNLYGFTLGSGQSYVSIS